MEVWQLAQCHTAFEPYLISEVKARQVDGRLSAEAKKSRSGSRKGACNAQVDLGATPIHECAHTLCSSMGVVPSTFNLNI